MIKHEYPDHSEDDEWVRRWKVNNTAAFTSLELVPYERSETLIVIRFSEVLSPIRRWVPSVESDDDKNKSEVAKIVERVF